MPNDPINVDDGPECEVCGSHGNAFCVQCEVCLECCTCWYCDTCDTYHLTDEPCPLEGLRPYTAKADQELGFCPIQNIVPPNHLYLGVELEVECRDGHTVRNVLDNLPELDVWVIAKEDGSLNNGLEIVTAPSDLAVHQERWPKILAYLPRCTYSWKAQTTGLHVHLSRRFFSQLDLAKFVYFINAEATRPWIVRLAGRDSNNYAKLTKKKWIGQQSGDSVLTAYSRYEAVNLLNPNTIEVRIFKGTLNTTHVLGDIEFCHALAHWVKVASLQDCDRWSKFWEYVENNRKIYAHLIDYVRDHPPQTTSTRTERRQTCVSPSINRRTSS
jgi:hypothetical protein